MSDRVVSSTAPLVRADLERVLDPSGSGCMLPQDAYTSRMFWKSVAMAMFGVVRILTCTLTREATMGSR